MLSEYIKVVCPYVSKYVGPIMLISVNNTGYQYFLRNKQAERVAKILYIEARKSFP